MEELLSEENYQKANKKVKLIGLIIMVLGLLLIGGAIYLLVSASNMSVPEMGDGNWFNASTNRMHMKSNGLFMLIPGIFLTFLGAIVRFVMGNQRKIMAYQMQQMIPLVTEGAEKMVPTATKITKEVAEEMTPTMTKMAKEISKEMAPVYGEVAKEITKGIKEGMKEEDK